MKVLYIGQLNRGSTSKVRYEIIKDLFGENVQYINISEIMERYPRLIRSIGWRYYFGPLIWRINRQISMKINSQNSQFDLIWIDKGVFILPRIIKILKSNTNKLVHYTPDTSFYENNSRLFRRSMKYFDFLIFTKSFELNEYRKRIAKEKLIILTQAFDPNIHFPRLNSSEKTNKITFIGLFEPEREEIIQSIIDNDLEVNLGGVGWSKFVERNKNNKKLNFIGEFVLESEYAQMISSSKFALGLLSKKFPEKHTTRTFEIPACGTCLVTEKNEEIDSFFNDDECIKFKTIGELVKLILFYQKNEACLEQITINGFRSVVNNKRDYPSQMRETLEKIGLI